MNWILLLSIIFLSSCGEESDENTITELEGTWTQSCSEGTQTTLTFSGSSVESSVISYSDENCATESLRIQSSASFVIGDAVSGVEGAKNIDFTTNSMTFTLKSADNLETYNSQSICGKSNWEVDVPQTVAASECGLPEGPSLDIFKITSENTLQFGNADDIEDLTTTRPTALEEASYTKS